MQLNKGKSLVTQTTAVKVRVTLVNPVTDLLPVVFGRWALTGQNPVVLLKQLLPDSAAEVALAWQRLGYIVGAATGWKFSPKLVKSACTTLAFRPEQQAPVPSLGDIIGRYRKLLKERPGEVKERFPNTAAFLAQLCKKYDPVFVMSSLKGFFHQRTTENFTVSAFANYLKSKNPEL